MFMFGVTMFYIHRDAYVKYRISYFLVANLLIIDDIMMVVRSDFCRWKNRFYEKKRLKGFEVYSKTNIDTSINASIDTFETLDNKRNNIFNCELGKLVEINQFLLENLDKKHIKEVDSNNKVNMDKTASFEGRKKVQDEVVDTENKKSKEAVIITKSEYEEILKRKRKIFIHTHFEDALKAAFEGLRLAAEKGEVCSYTVCFVLEEHFDANKMQVHIVEYFKDLGYQTNATISTMEPKEIVVVLN